MSRRVDRAGAIATVAMFCVALFAADGSGANATDQIDFASPEPAIEADLATSDATAIRFVAAELVQPLPEPAAPAEPVDTSAASAASLEQLVASKPVGRALSGELQCLAQAVYFEARGEPLRGQLAVAQVVINRSQSSLFPDDYCSVVTQRSQFSFVRNGRIPQASSGSEAWHKAVAIAQIAHQDLWDSEVDDALYFHATRVRPQWAGRLQARGAIARHVFYR